MTRRIVAACCLLVLPGVLFGADGPPVEGDTVTDFELPVVEGETVKLSDLTQDGPVVVVVLRGFPGYQCPLCGVQSVQFGANAKKFAKAGAKVVMIYPGSVDDLATKAKEFLAGRKIPEGFTLAIDPGYTMTNAWNLRWDAENETAYPSTFVIDKDMKVRWAKVSMKHGGRSKPKEVLEALESVE